MASIISAGTTSGTSLNLSGDTSGVLQLATNGTTTAVTIDTGQNVGIGTTTTTDAGVTITTSVTRDSTWDAKLALQSTGATDFPALFFSGCSSTSRYGGIIQTASTSGNTPAQITAGITFDLTSSTAGNILFSTNGNIGTTTATERMRINSNGNIVLQGGTIAATGTGITFPATQSASSDANCLDDYEEGTWTPTLTFSGGSTGITYTSRTARYTKIGRLVYVFAAVTLSNKGSSSGAANVNNLPFSSITNAVPGEFFVTAGGASIGSGFSAVFGTEIYFYNQASTDRQNLNDSNFTNTTEFSFSAVYEV